MSSLERVSHRPSCPRGVCRRRRGVSHRSRGSRNPPEHRRRRLARSSGHRVADGADPAWRGQRHAGRQRRQRRHRRPEHRLRRAGGRCSRSRGAGRRISHMDRGERGAETLRLAAAPGSVFRRVRDERWDGGHQCGRTPQCAVRQRTAVGGGSRGGRGGWHGKNRRAGSGERFTLTPDTRHLIAERFPKTRKNSSGYALDRFAETDDEVDLLIGSEGTLGIITAVHWKVDPIPPGIAGAALGFADLEAMTGAIPYLASLNPSPIELLDESLLRFVPEAPQVACLLLVEFEREQAAAARGVVGDAVRGLKHSAVHVETAVNRAGLEQLWSVRRLASPALAQLPATQRSLQVIEDGCVPPEALGAYVAGVREAARRRDVPVAIFGHAGDGHVHVNALPDTTRDGWREALAELFADVTDLLIRLGGVPSGEHGVGRLRAGVLERFYGKEVMDLFRDVKRAYDPLSILNPGVIIPATDWSPVAALKVGAGAAAIPEDIATRLREVERSAAWATPKLELAH